MSQPQKRKYVRRKKVQVQEEEPIVAQTPPLIPPSPSFKDITSIQDEEFEMSIMMDIIKMQEREEQEEKERLEKENEKQIRKLQEKIFIRDQNIKEILRKIKIGNSKSELETHIIKFLETTMETQDMHIHIYDTELYNNICSYLGMGDDNKKGTIRLPESVKSYAKNLFTFHLHGHGHGQK